MDIAKIQEYLNYVPVLDNTAEEIFFQLLETIDYIQEDERLALIQAFEFANRYHSLGRRLSGEEYMVHPVKVLEFLLYLRPDVVSMQVALLHDVIEDTEARVEEVKSVFGQEVADLCVGLEKVAKVKYRGEQRNIETLKKTFLAMGKDLRVIFIKLADRVHNIQTLHYHPSKQKRQRIAEETLKVYVPIARRLGLYVFQGLLENGAFYQLDQKEYNRIADWLEKNYGDVEQQKEEGIEKLMKICTEDGVAPVAVLGRLKSPYRIYTKLKKYSTLDISKIMDVLAFRIITASIVDCYSDLGAIHKHYTPIFSKMKDYIAIPKPNGYKSLHTTVLGMFPFPVEIQIRTQEMDLIANFGVAAHFAYADDRNSIKVSDEQVQWMEKLQKITTKYQASDDKDNFKHELDIEILQKNIFVYTPKGDIIELPQGCTVLDFAFRVHSDVGLKFKNALVNAKIVPIDFILKTGDIVDIQIFKNKFTAKRSRMNFLHTPSAKNKLNKFLRQEEKEHFFHDMHTIINTRLQEFSLPLLGQKDDKISKTYKHDEREQILFKIRDRQLTITRLIRQIYGDALIDELSIQSVRQINKQKREAVSILTEPKNIVIVDIDKKLDVLYCPECKPTPPQQIIARSGKDGIKIHALRCPALHTVDVSKLLEAHRIDCESALYHINLLVEMKDKPGMLLDLLRMFEYFGINVTTLHTGTIVDDSRREISIIMELENPSKLYFIFQELKSKKEYAKIISYAFIIDDECVSK